MKAIKIDSYANTVTVTKVSEDSRDISVAIGCRTFCVGRNLPKGDTVYVDDEGWLDGNVTRGFQWDGEFFAGNGLILGSDYEGDSCNPRIRLADVLESVQFAPSGWTISESMREKAISGLRVYPM